MAKNVVTRLQTERMKLEETRKAVAEARKNAVQMRSEAVSDLNAAKAFYDLGADHEEQGNAKASEAAVLLYKGQIAGLFSKEQVSAELGNVFGYKAKASSGIKAPVAANHPDASKTPFKRGEDIRKRIVRLTDAALFIDGKIPRPIYMVNSELSDDDAKAQASDILGDVNTGNQSVWSAYKRLGELKEARTSVNLAFDAAKLVKLIEEMVKPATANLVAQTPALRNAYVMLYAATEQLFDNMPEDEETGAGAGAQTQTAQAA